MNGNYKGHFNPLALFLITWDKPTYKSLYAWLITQAQPGNHIKECIADLYKLNSYVKTEKGFSDALTWLRDNYLIVDSRQIGDKTYIALNSAFVWIGDMRLYRDNNPTSATYVADCYGLN